jgi:chemotaxis protein methyltransferase CheR
MQTVILPQPPPLEEPETEPEPPREAEPTPLQEPDQPSRIERARELLDYGRSEEARDLLLQLSKSEQASAVIYSLLGKAYANLGLWQEAADWCQRAVNLDKLALEAYYTLALVLQHQDELRQAIEAMKKVVYIDRQHVLGHFGLANLYHQRGTLAQALKSLDNANRLLDSHSDDEVLPGSSGVTVGRLRDAIIRQQQTWSAGTGDSLGRGL